MADDDYTRNEISCFWSFDMNSKLIFSDVSLFL